MKIPYLRWWIAALLMGASLLNYVDRAALGVASKQIIAEFHLSAQQYALIVNAFLVAYTLSYLFGGMIVDRLGTRRSFIGTITWWSLANMAHAWARNLFHLMGFRFLLGLGEAMFYPAAIRCSAEWFQPKDRSQPIGLILAGASLGALLAPIIVAGMMTLFPGYGWRGAFAFTGALGFLLVPPWLYLARLPHRHPYLTEEERAYLADPGQAGERGNEGTRERGNDRGSLLHSFSPSLAPERPLPLRQIIGTRSAWLLIVARALTDAAWYLFLFWLLLYFQKERGFTVRMVAQYGWIPFAAADLGALFGGWLSSRLIRAERPVLRVRAICMMGFACLLPMGLAGYLVPSNLPFLALALCSVATFGHMAWGTNELTLHSDLFPANGVATIMGITGAAGAIMGIVAQQAVGALVDSTHSYLPVFIAAAFLHPIAGVIVLRGLRSPAPVLSAPSALAAQPRHP